MNNKYVRKITRHTILVLIITLLFLMSSISFGWFTKPDNSFNAPVSHGTIVGQYFEKGSGSESDPFVITRPIHYYHLVELYQRIVEYSTSNFYFKLGCDLNNDGEDEVYAYDNYGKATGSLSKTLNMAYYSGMYSLLPIGTSNIPFEGHFDGSNLTIDNLHICAKEVVNGVTYGTSDVGVFGYVQSTASIKDLYLTNLEISLDGSSTAFECSEYQSSHTSSSNTVYVGYLIGHLESYTNMTSSSVALPFSNVYLNNVSVTGSTDALYAKCDYGYVGHIETHDGNSGSSIAGAVAELGESGSGNSGWGGSIDMLTMNRRLTYMFAAGTQSVYKNYNPYSTSSVYNTKLVMSGNLFDWTNYYTSSSTRYLYMESGSFLPLNVNKETMGLDVNTQRSDKVTTAYGDMQVSINDQYYNQTPEAILNSNNGYLIGGGTGTSAKTRARISQIGALYKSLNLSGTSAELSSASGLNNMVLLTHSKADNSTFYVVTDDMNSSASIHSDLSSYTKVRYDSSDLNFNRYSIVKESFLQMLQPQEGQFMAHGIGFSKAINPTSLEKTSVSKDVILNGNTYSSYEFVSSSLNFNVASQGYLTAVVGSYFYNANPSSSSSKQSAFNLYQVNRNASNSITSITEISKVYVDSEGTSYINPSSTSGLTLVYSKDWYSLLPKSNSCYYIEIPLPAGDYALGCASTANVGAYLMYLDVGANGNQSLTYNSANKVNDTPLFTQVDYRTNGTSERSLLNIGYTIPSGSTSSNFNINVYKDTNNSYIYIIDITNTTGNSFNISSLLCDDDDDSDNTYPYSYKIKYNGSWYDDGEDYDGTVGYKMSKTFNLG